MVALPAGQPPKIAGNPFTHRPVKTTRLLLLSTLFLLLFNEPVISIMNRPTLVLGIPLLYAYVLLVWALLIGLLAYVIHRSQRTDESLVSDE